MNEDLMQNVDEDIIIYRHFIIDEPQKFSQVSKSVIYHIVNDKLHYKKNIYEMGTIIVDRTQKKAHSLSFLECYHKDGNEFL